MAKKLEYLIMSTWHDEYQVWLTEQQSLDNAQLVANHFGQRWTHQAISALCGNMRIESSINPNMYEYGYDWEDDRGYGLVQWTPRSKYWDWAVARNLPPESGESQLARIDYEQEQGIQWISTSDYPLSFNEFTQSREDIGYLTRAFVYNYERPADPEATIGERINFAQLVAQTVDFEGGGTPPDPDPDPEELTPEQWLTILGRRTNMRRFGHGRR